MMNQSKYSSEYLTNRMCDTCWEMSLIAQWLTYYFHKYYESFLVIVSNGKKDQKLLYQINAENS